MTCDRRGEGWWSSREVFLVLHRQSGEGVLAASTFASADLWKTIEKDLTEAWMLLDGSLNQSSCTTNCGC